MADDTTQRATPKPGGADLDRRTPSTIGSNRASVPIVAGPLADLPSIAPHLRGRLSGETFGAATSASANVSAMIARIAPALELSQSLERSACSLERSQNPSGPDVSFRRLELFFEFGIAIGAKLPPQHYRFVRAHAGLDEITGFEFYGSPYASRNSDLESGTDLGDR